MSDYTPTTEEVKNFYSERMSVSGYFEWSPSANAEFDAWLAQNNAEVASDAKQRIINWLDSSAFTQVIFRWYNESAKANIHEGALYETAVDELSDRLTALIEEDNE